jgi:hypothetical protein
MTFYSAWQPLRNEDAWTALVFGFLRHVPVEAALQPWVTETLGREARVARLVPGHFWPPYRSALAGHTRTVPELVFLAEDDRGELIVAVEAKRLPGGHDLPQLVREAVDSARHSTRPRLAVIMVGVDVGQPRQRADWERAIKAELADNVRREVQAELRYSSWAQLGKWIESTADSHPLFGIYAEDVLVQMKLQGLLGYKGAPMVDPTTPMTVPNAIETVNLVIKQARHFFLALIGEARFAALGLRPAANPPQMLRDGVGARSLKVDEGEFVTTTLLSHFRKATWPAGAGTFAAFYLPTGETEAHLAAGAYQTGQIQGIQYWFAWAEPVEMRSLKNGTLRSTQVPQLTESTHYANNETEWRYDVRPWAAGNSTGDIEWTLDALTAAVELWDGPVNRAKKRLQARARRDAPRG